ncbi:hypothetical protein [Echinicola sp. 20G]|uniref:hypothetical protein n=1 Tax=Echinicola sp. 20G TaxID=2781961 RepID=UPI001910C6B0|nr:hypothetical protein [Echinicola sp. 20G]
MNNFYWPCFQRRKGNKLLLFLVLSLLANNVQAQSPIIESTNALAEKVYLQLDSKIYTHDQTIWFKAIVANAASNRPTLLSGVLHAEIIGSDLQVKDEKLIKLQNGIGEGFFDLNRNYLPGRYLIRAYTQWDSNFGTDYIFKAYTDVFPSSKEDTASPISQVSLLEKSPGQFWLSANFNPLQIDSLHQKKLSISLNLDGKKDSLTLKKNKEGLYVINYLIPANSTLATLNMETENGAQYSKTIALDEEALDFQFFPESGELVHGLTSRVGFKALDYLGSGKQIEGRVIDGSGKQITTLKSNDLGMGSFVFLADSAHQYFAEIYPSGDSSVTYQYPLPVVQPKGYNLAVFKAGNNIRLIQSAIPAHNDSIFIKVTSRGIPYYWIKGRLKQGKALTTLPTNSLPEGIISFTLLDHHRQPVAERLFFNERLENRLTIQASSNQPLYTQREKTTVNIQIKDSNDIPIEANISVLAINGDLMGEIQEKRTNILSSLLLSGDLKGHIEKPGYYFQHDRPNHYNDLDVLMITQDWRNYHYHQNLDSLVYPAEPSLHVSGSVSGVFSSKKKKEDVALTLMTFGEKTTFQTQSTDSLGRFNFYLEDAYGEKIDVLIQSANKTGKKKNYTFSLDKKFSPEITFDQKQTIERLDSVSYALVEKHQEKSAAEAAFKLSTDIMELETFTVEDYLLTPEREKVMKRFGKPDRVIEGQDIQEKEEKWSYGLYSILLFNYPEDVKIYRVNGPGGYLRASVLSAEMTLVVIDGIPVMNYNYDLIPSIPPSEVKSVELIKFAKNFTSLFMEVYPQASPMEAPMTGSVIAIYTHAGKGIFGVQKPDGLLQTSVPAFSHTREFYRPNYENLSTQDWIKPDLRSVIHWQAQVKTDSTGQAQVNYYNADIPGQVMVIIEAIGPDGKIGYQELIYEVEERK